MTQKAKAYGDDYVPRGFPGARHPPGLSQKAEAQVDPWKRPPPEKPAQPAQVQTHQQTPAHQSTPRVEPAPQTPPPEPPARASARASALARHQRLLEADLSRAQETAKQAETQAAQERDARLQAEKTARLAQDALAEKERARLQAEQEALQAKEALASHKKAEAQRQAEFAARPVAKEKSPPKTPSCSSSSLPASDRPGMVNILLRLTEDGYEKVMDLCKGYGILSRTDLIRMILMERWEEMHQARRST